MISTASRAQADQFGDIMQMVSAHFDEIKKQATPLSADSDFVDQTVDGVREYWAEHKDSASYFQIKISSSSLKRVANVTNAVNASAEAKMSIWCAGTKDMSGHFELHSVGVAGVSAGVLDDSSTKKRCILLGSSVPSSGSVVIKRY
jgi:hypothetical protein